MTPYINKQVVVDDAFRAADGNGFPVAVVIDTDDYYYIVEQADACNAMIGAGRVRLVALVHPDHGQDGLIRWHQR